jgi:UDP-2,3-diacylglucosamine hydrolase
MVASDLPTAAELQAPPAWQCVDLISDLHLQASEPDTVSAWQRYLQQTPADALFMLGDLFEVWVGDDVLQASGVHAEPRFEQHCQAMLRDRPQRLAVYFMHGNRDFLFGSQAAQACGLHLLADPTVLVFDEQRWLLSHGDALCTDDLAYQAFRTRVRSPAWQQQFLSQTLAERDRMARELRQQSEARKHQQTHYSDVDPAAATAWLRAAHAQTLIHGHTHQPAEHALPEGRRRIVLSDWDARSQPPRVEILRLSPGQAPQRLTLDQALSV